MSIADRTTVADAARGQHPGAAPSATVRIVDLEGYRGLAAIGVLIFHCYQFCRGGPTYDYAYHGTVAGYLLMSLDSLVDLFLVLSSYLLYAPIVRRVLHGGTLQTPRGFLLRRAVRILPLYWMAILVVWASRNGTFPGHWVDLLEHLTFTQVYDSRYIFWTIGPAWSLAVEIHFYVLLAVILGVLRRSPAFLAGRRGRLAAVWTVPVVLLVGSTAWNLWALHQGLAVSDWAVWFNPLAKAHMLAAGMGLAVVHGLLRDRLPLGRAAIWGARALAALLLLAGTQLEHSEARSQWIHHQVATVAFTALLASSVLAPAGGAWRRALAHPVLLWLGGISYSIYLWHEPVLHWLDTHQLVSHQESAVPGVILTLLLSAVPVAAVSHYVLERPFGRLRQTFDQSGRRVDYYQDSASGDSAVLHRRG